MNADRLTPQREAEIAAAVAEMDADRALSFGTWTASPVTEKTTLPPEQAFAVEDVARLGNATLRGSVGVFGDERHAAFTALAHDAVPALLAELAAVRTERDQAQARVAELEGQPADTYPPAMPWAKLFDREDLADFLVELGQAAVGCDDVTEALGEVESVCGTWRLIGEAQHAHNTAPGPGAVDGAVA